MSLIKEFQKVSKAKYLYIEIYFPFLIHLERVLKVATFLLILKVPHPNDLQVICIYIINLILILLYKYIYKILHVIKFFFINKTNMKLNKITFIE